ncbi:peptidase [Microbacterium suwonense]|uniref:Peptidase n=1 Tax=Microbacterium suwonense TaxID=683047 RepID=A0ABN6X4D1_9MICO|nr:peptidase [Microbacterium suwonense]BDZ38596.1 hypothetical protein GCM10025863_12100 [Microbacterium suwonense]
MSLEIDWQAFLSVFAAALVGAAVIVLFYALGLRMLVRAGRIPVVTPAEFTDAITVLSEKEIKRAEKQAAKAARKNPLTEGQRQLAFVAAIACFAVCAVAVAGGILMIVIGH